MTTASREGIGAPESIAPGGPSAPRSRAAAAGASVEDSVAAVAAIGVAILPLLAIVLRWFHTGIPGSTPLTENLTLAVGLLGAAIAAREGKLLALATGSFLPAGRVRAVAELLAGAAGAAIAVIFAWGGWTLVGVDREVGSFVTTGLPTWLFDALFPIAFGLIAWRLAWRASPHWRGRAFAALGILAGLWIATHQDWMAGQSAWPWLIGLFIAAVLGAPIFALLGGAAVFLFLVQGDKPVGLAITAYGQLTNEALATIPLFTLAGFLLAEGRSSERLLRLFRAFFGWMPGGTAVVTAALCAFFTTFTGGSGVTILALGGLLLPALLADGYRDRFSLGLITASGSLGLLLPPALPLMLFAIIAGGVAMEDLFVAGFLPGLLLLGLVAVLGVREGLAARTSRPPFRLREAAASAWDAKWELLLPIVVLAALLGGYATPVESAALAALYALIVQRFIHRDLSTARDVVRVMGDCIGVVGGVLVILAVAIGLTNYLVDARIPDQLAEWATTNIHSQALFLLALNGFLLVVGCLMDIFSAIIIVVPLIVPIATAFNIDLVRLGIIFVANLELGYLTPPVGLNLFLSSYRFKRPVLEVARASLPMLGILALGVLLITYWPWLTTGLLHLMGRL